MVDEHRTLLMILGLGPMQHSCEGQTWSCGLLNIELFSWSLGSIQDSGEWQTCVHILETTTRILNSYSSRFSWLTYNNQKRLRYTFWDADMARWRISFGQNITSTRENEFEDTILISYSSDRFNIRNWAKDWAKKEQLGGIELGQWTNRHWRDMRGNT